MEALAVLGTRAMSACNHCWAWDAPFAMPVQRASGGHPITMRYEQFLTYHLHVNIHQKNADGTMQWHGELTPRERLS